MIPYLLVRVQPRASRNRVVVEPEGVKIYTTSAPVDNEANEAVISLLAKALKVPKTSIEITLGHTSRNKRVVIDGLEPTEPLARLASVPGNV